jgi:hypothetical protein
MLILEHMDFYYLKHGLCLLRTGYKLLSFINVIWHVRELFLIDKIVLIVSFVVEHKDNDPARLLSWVL